MITATSTFSKISVFKVSSVHTIFEKLHFRDGLVRKIGLTVKSLKFSKAHCGPGLILVEFVNVKTVTCK